MPVAVIAGGVNSNVRLLAARAAHLHRAAGAHMWDVDGNEYVDYAGGMGPMLLGHNHPAYRGGPQGSLDVGQCFAGQNETRPSSAKRLVAAVPWIESIRIGLDRLRDGPPRRAHRPGGHRPHRPPVRRALPRLARPAARRRPDRPRPSAIPRSGQGSRSRRRTTSIIGEWNDLYRSSSRRSPPRTSRAC